MADERRDPCFAAESLDTARFRDLLGAQQLDGNVALEPRVARAEDLGRSVAPDGLDQLVVGDSQRAAAPA
jgi:hypothetical protein